MSQCGICSWVEGFVCFRNQGGAIKVQQKKKKKKARKNNLLQEILSAQVGLNIFGTYFGSNLQILELGFRSKIFPYFSLCEAPKDLRPVWFVSSLYYQPRMGLLHLTENSLKAGTQIYFSFSPFLSSLSWCLANGRHSINGWKK